MTLLFNKQKTALILNDARQQKQYIKRCSQKLERSKNNLSITNNYMYKSKQIQKLAVRTPRIVQITFLAILLLPLLFAYWVYEASAASVRDNRTVQCQNAFIWYEYNPKLEKVCRNKWTLWSNQIKRSFKINK